MIRGQTEVGKILVTLPIMIIIFLVIGGFVLASGGLSVIRGNGGIILNTVDFDGIFLESVEIYDKEVLLFEAPVYLLYGKDPGSDENEYWNGESSRYFNQVEEILGGMEVEGKECLYLGVIDDKIIDSRLNYIFEVTNSRVDSNGNPWYTPPVGYDNYRKNALESSYVLENRGGSLYSYYGRCLHV
jgi:hypothetical protein